MSPHSANAWKRAAVYGSLWAAVEIVVGSFLHNLRLPFAGSILSAFGVMVLTAGHRSCAEQGFIWRAALVCALMKSISPSAVIMGPMIGIAMEGVILATSVRLMGANGAGYLLGGALAVSWSIAQRILSSLVTYGFDVVRLYVEAYNYASRSLGITGFGPFDLIAALVFLECLAGAGAAALGMRVGRAASIAAVEPVADVLLPGADGASATVHGDWSAPRLGFASAGLLAGMVVVGTTPLWLSALYVLAFAAVTARFYPRSLVRLRRPSLWIELVVVVLLAGLLLGGVREGMAGLAAGLAAGAAMVLRATLVLFGFTAISVELRNPIILAWVERRHLRGLSDALEVAFGTLPAFTAALSNQRHAWRQPATLLGRLIQLANVLVRASERVSHTRRLAILTGDTGSGKTTLASLVVDRLRAQGLRVAGVLALGLIGEGRRSGFDLVNLATGRSVPLAREGGGTGEPAGRWSRFEFTAPGLQAGHDALGINALSADVVVVDEVGPLELAGGGWAAALDALMRGFDGAVLLVVRRSSVDAVKARWGSPDTAVFDVAQATPDRLADALSREMSASQQT